MRIAPLEKDEADEGVRQVYQAIESKVGRVGNFYKMLAHKPEVLRTFRQFYDAIWAPGALSPRLKELAYLRTSIRNGCEY